MGDVGGWDAHKYNSCWKYPSLWAPQILHKRLLFLSLYFHHCIGSWFQQKFCSKQHCFLSHPMQAYHKGLLGAFGFYCQGPLWRLIEIKSSIHQGSCAIVITRLYKEIWNLSGICLEYISQNGWYIRQDCLQESPGETLLRLLPSLPTSLVICKNDCLFLLHPTNQPSNQLSNQTCLSLPLPPPPLLLAASCTPQSMVVIITW